MPGHAAQIVGREHELETIDRLLEALPTGAFLEVVGEAGIGKTRLLEALRENADDRGLVVAEGRGWEFERDYPFGVLVDALDEYLESLDAREVERAAGDVTTELAAVFPALRTLGGGGGLVASERFRAHEAVGLLLERLAGGRGLLLVLDDVHWADDATIELVTHLLRRRPAARVVIALAYRPRQLALRLAAALAQAGRRGIVERIELSPLSESEAAALLPPTTGPEAARRLYELSGGNPYYLEQLTRGSDGVPAHDAAAGEPAGLAVPAAVSAALAHELFMVGDAARELLEAAAVVGEPFELDVAAEVAPLELPVALEALDELVERDLLRGTEVPRRFRFRHPIVLRAVYEASRPGWRLAAHERAARALAARGQTALAVARHVAHSATIGDEDAIALLTDAAETAAPRAPAAAAHWFESALTLVPPEDAPRRSVLLTRLAFNRAVTGALDEARAAMIEALEALPDDAVESRIKTISFCAAIEHLLGRHQEAHDRLTSAMGAIPERDSPAAAAIAIELAADGLLHLDFEQMRTWADRGIVLTEEVGEPLLTAAATGVLALAELHDGRSEDAGRRSADACTLIDGLSDERVSERLEGVYYLAAVEYLLERDDDAIRHLERGIAISRQTGQDFLITTMTALLALAAKRRGRIGDAVALSRDAAEGGRLSGNRQALAQALTAHCWALLAAGDVRAALAAGKEAATATPQLGTSAMGSLAGVARAAALLEDARGEEAREALLAAVGGPDLPLLIPGLECQVAELLVRAELAAGDRPAAELAAQRAEDAAQRLGLRLARAQARRARALVALDTGDPAEVAAVALESAELAEDAGAPLEAARSLLVGGRALRLAGNRERAAAELRRAHAAATATGAMRLRDECEQELRQAGARPHRRSAPASAPDERNLEALTGRELEVAQLVRDRKMNREIAATLFLSEKTVETHLRNIFAKLGVSSRREVAEVIEASAGGGGEEPG